MVTTADDDAEVEPIGAIAAFGGKVEVIVRDAAKHVSYGETRLLTPMALIALTSIPVLWEQPPLLSLFGVLTLLALTVWCCVQVLRKGANR